MTHTTLRIALLVIIGLNTRPASASDGAALPEGFKPLFNGRNLEGWWGCSTENPEQWNALPDHELKQKMADSKANIAKHWRAENGELINDGEGLYLTTVEQFEDFDLRLEFRTVAEADSGIYLRGIPQVQIWDTTEAGGKWNLGADKGSGGLWNNSAGAPGKDPLVLADRPFGEWNRASVVMLGERVTVHLNGRLVVDHARLENYFDRSKAVPRRGPIQLQTHGGKIQWRHVIIRPIPAEEANALLAIQAASKFEPIFNGSDLQGWKGATDGYEVVDGAIVCRRGHGGNLFTAAEYADFTARLEFKLPPGGNNGLAIRYPGLGDPAYSGMCELQVLDNTHSKFANLDPRQYHGSIYGRAAAHRGYLRSAGQWNFQEVTVRGAHIVVELNGTRILDADTSTLADPMVAIERFEGRLRRSGHFGFAGHGDTVAFRNLRIRKH